MNKKISLGAAIAFMLVVATLTLALTMVYSMNRFTTMVNDVQQQRKNYQKISVIDQTVRDRYPDAIDDGKLMDSVAAGYMAGLDDPGRYYTASEYQRFLTTEEGRYYGIGIVPAKEPSGYIQIQEVYPDSPAQTAQLSVGDVIVKVDELDVTAETYDQAVALLQGDAGTMLALTVRRGTEDLEMEITRRQVDIPTVYYQVFDQTGYMRIKRFTTATRDQFNKYLNQAIGAGVQSLIIDLRDNTGGRYSAMAPALELLVPRGDLLMARYKDGKDTVLYTSGTSGVELPVVVLTNEQTTGTAELFAQVLKDTGVGKTVGVQTMGDGKLQEFFKLSDGSALLLTVARYVTPAGTVIDGEGVKPDYEVKLEGETVNWDNLTADTDSQLSKALELAAANVKVDAANTSTSESSSESSQGE